MRTLFLMLLSLLPAMLFAEVKIFEYEGNFEEAEESLATAIEAQGLKVDHISNVSDMLEHTAEAAGATEVTYQNARVFQFCSSTLSRKVMEIDPVNLAFCPYQIFVYQLEGDEKAVFGYRSFPEGEMQEVDALVNAIIEEALAF